MKFKLGQRIQVLARKPVTGAKVGSTGRVKSGQYFLGEQDNKLHCLDNYDLIIIPCIPIGEQITENNYKYLKPGDIVYNRCTLGRVWKVFSAFATKEGFGSIWGYFWNMWGANTIADVIEKWSKKESYQLQVHSLKDMGIQKNDYNDHKTYYMGNIFIRNQKEEGVVNFSKYQDLKNRINNLKGGWTKEADDILQEIYFSGSKVHFKYYSINIGVRNDCLGRGGVQQVEVLVGANRVSQVSFYYNFQHEKMDAFKKALMWLLDRSGIKEAEEKTYHIGQKFNWGEVIVMLIRLSDSEISLVNLKTGSTCTRFVEVRDIGKITKEDMDKLTFYQTKDLREIV